MCQKSVCIFISGLYPQIGWRLGDEVVYVMEGASHDTGSLIKWAEQIGIIIIHCHTELPYLVTIHKYYLFKLTPQDI